MIKHLKSLLPLCVFSLSFICINSSYVNSSPIKKSSSTNNINAKSSNSNSPKPNRRNSSPPSFDLTKTSIKQASPQDDSKPSTSSTVLKDEGASASPLKASHTQEEIKKQQRIKANLEAFNKLDPKKTRIAEQYKDQIEQINKMTTNQIKVYLQSGYSIDPTLYMLLAQYNLVPDVYGQFS